MYTYDGIMPWHSSGPAIAQIRPAYCSVLAYLVDSRIQNSVVCRMQGLAPIVERHWDNKQPVRIRIRQCLRTYVLSSVPCPVLLHNCQAMYVLLLRIPTCRPHRHVGPLRLTPSSPSGAACLPACKTVGSTGGALLSAVVCCCKTSGGLLCRLKIYRLTSHVCVHTCVTGRTAWRLSSGCTWHTRTCELASTSCDCCATRSPLQAASESGNEPIPSLDSTMVSSHRLRPGDD